MWLQSIGFAATLSYNSHKAKRCVQSEVQPACAECLSRSTRQPSVFYQACSTVLSDATFLQLLSYHAWSFWPYAPAISVDFKSLHFRFYWDNVEFICIPVSSNNFFSGTLCPCWPCRHHHQDIVLEICSSFPVQRTDPNFCRFPLSLKSGHEISFPESLPPLLANLCGLGTFYEDGTWLVFSTFLPLCPVKRPNVLAMYVRIWFLCHCLARPCFTSSLLLQLEFCCA